MPGVGDGRQVRTGELALHRNQHYRHVAIWVRCDHTNGRPVAGVAIQLNPQPRSELRAQLWREVEIDFLKNHAVAQLRQVVSLRSRVTFAKPDNPLRSVAD